MSKPLRPIETEYGIALRERRVRIAEWLGFDLALTQHVVDDDPDSMGRIAVEWEAIAVLRPSRGVVVSTRAQSGFGSNSPAIYGGTVLLNTDDSAAFMKAVGPQPELLTPEHRAQLRGLRP